ncbi:YceI family protein [Nakamurella sp. PAMC28650]|jgi:polyisoprenoid-binding protein YceI|uniref:YceI family protein n=1 Tax=Nakamurella sp. PAMC28650 TaxID=2762325 RepID=UPI00164DA11F|nr:YceI family protein [Nakamurella sp. PAMC28650]QNK80827.1 YceI family protein [Nakamurella sp. PAMC28650]
MSTPTTVLTGTWVGDAVHSDVSFKVRHMAVGKAKGTFALESATLTVPEAGLAEASVTAVIDAASVDTKQEQRNEHVKSPDFLHVEQYPSLKFVSTGVKNFDGDEFILVGDLTIRGITRSVELETEFLGATTDAYGAERAGFSATTSISRKEFEVSFNAAFGAGNSVVSDKVEIALELEFTKSA